MPNISDFSFKILEVDDKYNFDCGDTDLTEFFHNDAIPHKKALIGVTYFFYDNSTKSAISFFTVSNDAIQTKPFKDELHAGKRYSSYPAVKIGRFGVAKEYQRQHIGQQTMDFIKQFFVVHNKTGCRFLIVDAYNKSNVLKFYKESGFTFLSDDDINKRTRIMKYDLKIFCDALHIESFANR
jgi:GNAT superfamily N-acetyltransferase